MPLLAALGPPLAALGALLGALGALLGRSWDALGASWAPLGRSWAPLGRLLDASWAQLGKKAGAINLLGPNLEAKIQPSWLQNPKKINVEKQLDFNAFSSDVFRIC